MTKPSASAISRPLVVSIVAVVVVVVVRSLVFWFLFIQLQLLLLVGLLPSFRGVFVNHHAVFGTGNSPVWLLGPSGQAVTLMMITSMRRTSAIKDRWRDVRGGWESRWLLRRFFFAFNKCSDELWVCDFGFRVQP